MLHLKTVLVFASFFIVAILFMKCSSGRAESKDPRGKYYAGSDACMSCHADIVSSSIHSAHGTTSLPIGKTSVAEYYADADSSILYGDSGFVTVRKQANHFSQVYHKNDQTLNQQEFALAIGSGEKAQSYGYWRNGELMQLPLTYLAAKKRWVNSPGFSPKSPYFNRPILSRCLECHASYAAKQDVAGGPMQIIEKIDPSSIVYGIDCERCHGPSIDHVRFHEQFPEEKNARYVKSIATLTRKQKVELCASCHSGNDQDMQRPLFGFKPGDALSDYVVPSLALNSKESDVHGKQAQLLMSGKCYRSSQMTCQSCHQLHATEKPGNAIYVSKCLDCHSSSAHAVALKSDPDACLNCHMPAQASRAISFTGTAGRPNILYMLRTHRIAVYTDTAKLAPK